MRLGKSSDGPVSRYINRRVSTRITSFILRHNIPVTPNQVSLVSFLLAVLSGLLFYMHQWVLAGVLAEIASIVDGVDGELARARGEASPVGGFVDAVLDRFADASILFGLTLAVYADWGLGALVVGMAALFGDLMVSYVHARGEASLGVHPSRVGRVPMFASRDVRLFLVFLLGGVGLGFVVLAVVAGVSLLYVVAKTVEIYVYFKRGGQAIVS